ncbi:MAG TPA: hypothetical protein DEO71_04915 [Chryseobacterium sp.]|nr:hypothetical protein [Chryseobacterium sp.]
MSFGVRGAGLRVGEFEGCRVYGCERKLLAGGNQDNCQVASSDSATSNNSIKKQNNISAALF